ncbi:MAG: hypothetical protein F6K31_27080 [Symploca sp. SIO2G7]|nr:hypothetical protein [Symploca sp. SIO2G7]
MVTTTQSTTSNYSINSASRSGLKSELKTDNHAFFSSEVNKENNTSRSGLKQVTETNPCPHCGKDDWCYSLDNLSVCKREAPPAAGWYKTSKSDSKGTPYYAPVTEKKAIRSNQTRYWEYPARDESKLVRVKRVDTPKRKDIKQQRWDGTEWQFGLKGYVKREDIPPYKYKEIREAIKAGQTIFIVEGEVCADALWKLGIPATTNIGGSGKWRPSDTEDLKGAKVVLVPDRDKPGLKHMISIAEQFPDAQWLLAYPDSSKWQNLPASQGVDIADWIADFKLSAEDISSNVRGQEYLKNILNQLEKSTNADNADNADKTTEKKKLPPASDVASVLAEKYREQLAWESEYQMWRQYGGKQLEGVWSQVTPESVRGLIQAHLRANPDYPGFTSGFVSSIEKILQSDLEVIDWNEQKGLIPLQDGVLEQSTMKLLPHQPGYRFTWQLPYKWKDSNIDCSPIEEFLLKITGHSAIAEVLLCYLAAIVTQRSDLQRYLELIGGGGTGKSTFMSLAKALAGHENTVSSQLKLLENNQFETAKFYKKLLVLFPDSERWQGGVSVLKQLTGQDPIRYERKGVQQCRDFVYEGMVILSANEPPESTDRTSGQERRKLTIELDNRIPEYEGRDLKKEFEPLLPGLLRRVLEIPRERVTKLIKFTERYVPALAQKKWSQLCQTNPIAGWAEECLVAVPGAKARIGLNQEDMVEKWLYSNFCDFQSKSGHKGTIPVKRFSNNLRDLLKNQIKLPISEGRDKKGAYIEGIGLRCFYDPDPNGENYDRLVTGLPFANNSEVTDSVVDGDGLVTAETIGSVGFDGYDGFLEKVHEKEKSVCDPPESLSISTHSEGRGNEPEFECQPVCEKNPSHPSNPTLPVVSAITEPVTQPVTQPVTEEKQPTPSGVDASQNQQESQPCLIECEVEQVASRMAEALELEDEVAIEQLKEIRREVGGSLYNMSGGMLNPQLAARLDQLRLNAKQKGG